MLKETSTVLTNCTEKKKVFRTLIFTFPMYKDAEKNNLERKNLKPSKTSLVFSHSKHSTGFLPLKFFYLVEMILKA